MIDFLAVSLHVDHYVPYRAVNDRASIGVVVTLPALPAGLTCDMTRGLYSSSFHLAIPLNVLQLRPLSSVGLNLTCWILIMRPSFRFVTIFSSCLSPFALSIPRCWARSSGYRYP